MAAHMRGQRVKFLRSAVRLRSDSADGRRLNIFITTNSHGVPSISSGASPYQPAGNSGGTDVPPSWPFWAQQGASRV